MALKIDLEKAYDRLRWPFIRETLMDLRLPIKLVEVIMNCLNCSSFNVLRNGEKTDSFTQSLGVRQEDPLSPYLLVLCLERLNHIIEDAVNQGAWKAITTSQGGPPLSRLCFADDVVLFGEATLEQARVINHCLDLFAQLLEKR